MLCLVLVLCFAAADRGQAQIIAATIGPACTRMTVQSADVDHFWHAWDIWQRQNSGDPATLARVLQTEYIDKATPGLLAFMPHRVQSAGYLAETILKDPGYYAELRPLVAEFIASAPQLRNSCQVMTEIHPESRMPTVYLVVGARNSGGTNAEAGLILGVEMFSRRPTAALNPDDFVGLVTHELIHFEQKPSERNTLLHQSMIEGAADFIAELIAGRNGNERNKAYADGHEQELWEKFSREMYGAKLGDWLYNAGTVKTNVLPDLGYYMGYKICQAYYEHASDKRAALRQIVPMENEEQILKNSSYGERFREN